MIASFSTILNGSTSANVNFPMNTDNRHFISVSANFLPIQLRVPVVRSNDKNTKNKNTKDIRGAEDKMNKNTKDIKGTEHMKNKNTTEVKEKKKKECKRDLVPCKNVRNE